MANPANATFTRIDYLARAPRAPRIRDAALRLADQATREDWTRAEYLQAAAVADAALSNLLADAPPPRPGGGPYSGKCTAWQAEPDQAVDPPPGHPPHQGHRRCVAGHVTGHPRPRQRQRQLTEREREALKSEEAV